MILAMNKRRVLSINEISTERQNKKHNDIKKNHSQELDWDNHIKIFNLFKIM